jgi:hypothetical protein
MIFFSCISPVAIQGVFFHHRTPSSKNYFGIAKTPNAINAINAKNAIFLGEKIPVNLNEISGFSVDVTEILS